MANSVLGDHDHVSQGLFFTRSEGCGKALWWLKVESHFWKSAFKRGKNPTLFPLALNHATNHLHFGFISLTLLYHSKDTEMWNLFKWCFPSAENWTAMCCWIEMKYLPACFEWKWFLLILTIIQLGDRVSPVQSSEPFLVHYQSLGCSVNKAK